MESMQVIAKVIQRHVQKCNLLENQVNDTQQDARVT